MLMLGRARGQSMFGKSVNILLFAAGATGLLLSQACGGGTSSTKSPLVLESITISPTSSLVALGGTRKLKATGVYGDGSTQNLTSSVTWSASSAPSTTNFVSVDPTGLATGLALGTSIVTANLGPVLGATSLIVNTNGYESSTIGILFVPFQGSEVDAGYLPQSRTRNSQGVFTVQEVNLDSDQFGPLPVASALIASIPMPAGYVPSATAASQSNLEILVISHSSADVQIIDASNDPKDTANNTIINTFHSPITKTAIFNGVSCMICAVVIGPSGQVLLSTAQGYYTMDINSGQFTALPLAPPAFPALNFSLNPLNAASPFIISPTFGQDANFSGEVQVLNLANNTVATNTNLGISAPVATAMDLVTNIGVVVDESSTTQFLVNLSGNPFPVTAWNSQNSIAQPIIFGCSAPPAPLTMVAIGVGVGAQSQDHIALFSQASGSCIMVEALPSSTTLGPPDPALIVYGYGALPPTPDGLAFINGNDPNAITTFTSVFDKKSYGLLVDANQNWIAKLNLNNYASQNTNSGPGSAIVLDFVNFPVPYLPTQ